MPFHAKPGCPRHLVDVYEEAINVFRVVAGRVAIIGKKHGTGASSRIVSRSMRREV